MSQNVQTQLTDFLSETEQYFENACKLTFDVATELYDMLDEAAKVATENIKSINPELRVKICDKRDLMLDVIVDMLGEFDPAQEQAGIYTPAIQGHRKWTNMEMLKDKALTGYMLAKTISGKSTWFFCTKKTDYPNLVDLPEMEMLCNESNDDSIYYEHLKKEFTKMDILVLHGMYPETVDYLRAYKDLRPDGLVYCGLDMNSSWIEKINWESATVDSIVSRCNIVATSCRAVRDMLNRRKDVNFECHWFPNGFFNPTGTELEANFKAKENIILTVGRIGSEQKNTQELLEGFAKAKESGKINDWKLRLVGPIAPEFNEVIDEFFVTYPKLKEQVTFVGSVMKKEQLYSEYARAKIFALTSKIEGGTPNVYAEALNHGCMFITSEVDAAQDITNNGELGKSYEIGNIAALVNIIGEICAKATQAEMETHIRKALDYAKKYYNWNRNAKKLAYMLFR